IFGPLRKVQGTLGSCQILGSHRRGRWGLSDLRVFQRTLVNAVPLTPAVGFRLGQEAGVALHALRLRDAVFATPVVLAVRGVAHERGKLGDGPVRQVAPNEQTAESSEHE